MRLPSSVLAKLTLAGLAVGATSCERVQEPQCKTETVVVESDPRPLDEVVRERPAVAPKVVQKPQPQPTRPDPQPVITKKPKPRMVWASVCGHTELVPENAAMVKCGKG